MTVSISVISFIALICSPCCYKFFKKRKDVLCYLCHSKVASHLWHNGTHREACEQNNRQFLDNLPTPCDVFCPKCEIKLKLWPVQDHAKFRCHSKQCLHHKPGLWGFFVRISQLDMKILISSQTCEFGRGDA